MRICSVTTESEAGFDELYAWYRDKFERLIPAPVGRGQVSELFG